MFLSFKGQIITFKHDNEQSNCLKMLTRRMKYT